MLFRLTFKTETEFIFPVCRAGSAVAVAALSRHIILSEPPHESHGRPMMGDGRRRAQGVMNLCAQPRHPLREAPAAAAAAAAARASTSQSLFRCYTRVASIRDCSLHTRLFVSR